MNGGAPKALKAKLTLRAANAFMPAVARAVRDHKAAQGGFITDIVLPAHRISAYNKVLGWVWATINAGQVQRPSRVESYAVRTYNEVKAIGDDTGMAYLSKAMQARLDQMAMTAGQMLPQ